MGAESSAAAAEPVTTTPWYSTSPIPWPSVSDRVVSSGTGSITSAIVQNGDYVVNLTGVTTAQTITVTLTGISDTAGNSTASLAVPMGVLVGDVNVSRRVDGSDVSLIRQQNFQTISTSNFREDVNASGRIDGTDVSIARQQNFSVLPP